MDDKEKLKHARERVAQIKGFYIHLTVFVLVMTGLVILDVMKGEGWWVQWPLLGWGLGVLGHAFAVFGGGGPNIFADWEKRKIKEYMNRD